MNREDNLLFLLTFYIAILMSILIPDLRDKVLRRFKGKDQDLKPYVDMVAKRLNIQNHPRLKALTLGFVSDRPEDSDTIGQCFYARYPGLGPEIEIYYPTWAYRNETGREELILHEIGHCVCWIIHTWEGGFYGTSKDEVPPSKTEDMEAAGYFTDGCPKSVIHPTVSGNYCFNKRKNYYYEEISRRCKR